MHAQSKLLQTSPPSPISNTQRSMDEETMFQNVFVRTVNDLNTNSCNNKHTMLPLRAWRSLLVAFMINCVHYELRAHTNKNAIKKTQNAQHRNRTNLTLLSWCVVCGLCNKLKMLFTNNTMRHHSFTVFSAFRM
jgi:hypothetical protein